MEQQEPNYVDGFSQGYKLSKHTPHLFEKLKGTLNPENEYDQGLIAGAEKAAKEKEQQRLQELEQTQGKTREQDKSVDR